MPFPFIPVVPLSTFMNFNKIKEMATSVDDIEKAIYNSELLELSCDKQRVRRITEIQIKDDVDEFTVYVVSVCVTTFAAMSTNSTHSLLGRVVAVCNTRIGAKSI